MNVRGRSCLVVGGGEVAARKAALLRRAGARVTVVAPDLGAGLADEAATGRIVHRAGVFAPEHLDGAVLVVAATGDRRVDAQIARLARLRGLPVNVVDDPALCSFVMPAIVDRAPVIVAVSTGGASPVLARWVRARIEAALPAALGCLAEIAGRYRDVVRRRVPDLAARRRFWERLFAGPVADFGLAGRRAEAEAALLYALHDDDPTPEGEVHLVGAGPGDPDLLTVRALRLVQTADAIVYDRLVAPEIVELSRRDAERFDAGKSRGAHAMTQDEIHALLIRLAREGKRVVRLKGGDPFVFGRGGEEIAALIEAGVVCHVVPGITAATGCGAYAGIPLTHRDYAQHCVFVTGHGRDGEADLDWSALARPRQTLVVYMGLGALPTIAARLIDHGMAPDTPAAVVEKGTTPDQRVIVGTLADIGERTRAAAVGAPALIIVGDVVRLAKADAARSPDLAVAV